MKQLTLYKANQNKSMSVSLNNTFHYKNLMWRLIVLILLGFITTIAIKAQPIVKSIIPASGSVGSSVTISGSHFDTTLANIVVYFGAVVATVTSASDTSLTVTVPSGATYQPISVINLSTNLSGTSANPFNVTYNSGVGQAITSSSFNARVNFTSGLNPADIVAVADLDGDGKPDMVVVNRLTNTFSVFRNRSDAICHRYEYAPGTTP